MRNLSSLSSRGLRIAVSTEGEPSGVMEFLEGLRAGLPADKYALLALPGGPENNLSRLGKRGGLDGLVGSFAGLPSDIPGLMLVNLEILSHIDKLPSVSPDWQTAGRAALEHLSEIGLKRVAFLGARGQFAARELLKGFAQAAAGAGIPCEEGPPLPQAQAAWLKTLPGPVGLLCPSPATAARLLLAAQEQGLAIPEDLAVITTGDTALASLQAGLEISTLPLPFHALGHGVAEIFRMAGGSPGAPIHRKVPVGAIQMRASTQRRAGRYVAFDRLFEQIAHEMEYTLSVEGLAARAGMSRRAFELTFRERTGRSPARYLRQLRMEKAQMLLRATTVPVAEVGIRCGYPEPHVFSATFKRETGMSPLSWRHGKMTTHALAAAHST